jgi:hypothetical protein
MVTLRSDAAVSSNALARSIHMVWMKEGSFFVQELAEKKAWKVTVN